MEVISNRDSRLYMSKKIMHSLYHLGFQWDIDNDIDDSQRSINMMDASSRRVDLSKVAVDIAEADELSVWSADKVEEYFPRESLETNKAGEIILP
jgi:hypothetical protein